MLIILNGICQERISYSEVVRVLDSAKSEILFERLDNWFAATFINSKEVIQVKGKNEGKIIGNVAMKFKSPIFAGSAIESGYINYS